MKIKMLDVGGFFRAAKSFGRDVVASPLRSFLIYSAIVHVVVIVGFSPGMYLPEKPKTEPPATAAATHPAAENPAAAATPGTSGTPAASSDKSAGKAENYYKREGIDTTPATREQIPKNPFDVKDETK